MGIGKRTFMVLIKQFDAAFGSIPRKNRLSLKKVKKCYVICVLRAFLSLWYITLTRRTIPTDIRGDYFTDLSAFFC
jgi:hypothetical protein